MQIILSRVNKSKSRAEFFAERRQNGFTSHELCTKHTACLFCSYFVLRRKFFIVFFILAILALFFFSAK